MDCNTSRRLSLIIPILLSIFLMEIGVVGSDEVISDEEGIEISIDWIPGSRWFLRPRKNRDPIEAFSKSIDLDPKDFKSYINRGNAYTMRDQYDMAINDYTKAIDLQPKDGEAYNNRGIAFGKKQQYDRAIEDLSMAVALNPRDFKAYVNRGNAYRMINRYDLAVKDYTRAIELQPRQSIAYYNLSCIYSLRKNPSEACRLLKKSIENGFNKWNHIRSNICFDAIRNSACYQEIIIKR